LHEAPMKHTVMAVVLVVFLGSGGGSLLPLSGSACASETSSEAPGRAPSGWDVLQPPIDTSLPYGIFNPDNDENREQGPTAKSAEPEQPSSVNKQTTAETSYGFFDVMHRGISDELRSTATWLDSYFGDDRAVMEQNRSYLRVRYDMFQEEKSSVLLKPAFDMRLVLPQLERKTHIVLTAEPSSVPGGAVAPLTPAGERIVTPEEGNVTAALLYLFRSVPKESVIVRTGIQVNQFPPVAFISPRYRSLNPLASWNFRFTQEATYRTDTRWQADTLLDFERPLPHDLFFRTSIEGNWYEGVDGYFANLVFSLREVFDASHALDYEWVNSYQTGPSYELTEIAFRIRFRRSFWREWLFYELAPQMRYPRSGNFDKIPGILFRLEMFFGRISN
jgi:hypothetical protein